MKHFSVIVRELRLWLTSYSWVQWILPYAMYIMFGSVAVQIIDYLIWQLSGKSFSIVDVLSTIGYFTFLLGFWLTLISPQQVKYAPYGLFAEAIYVLYPFTSFSLYEILRAGILIYFGYWLLRYTAMQHAEQQTEQPT
ncbi:hypothetical protein ABEV74_14525 [Paenibacillus cisolokensis]|uniref:hypothetical protein n=1 Tax=Paenibacillus cisolokensis TaxID=1658519 RepID=UPI003D2AE7C4